VNPDSYQATILVVNQALSFPDMGYSLLNPNQLRHAGLDVWDNQVCVASQEGEDILIIPILIEGTVLYFESRTPTLAELDTLTHYPLTLENDWDPHTVQLGRKVMAATSYMGEGIEEHCELFHDGYSYSIEPYLLSREVAQVATDLPNARGFQSSKRHPHANAETLSNLWYIVLPLSRRLVTDLVYRKPRLRGRFYTDTEYGRHSLLTGNKCMKVFVNKSFFAVAYPMETKRYAGKALKEFINEIGIPELLTFDGSKEQTAKNSEFMQTVRKYDIDYHISKPYQPKQNPAERVIRELC
jgi:hypothetical protein